MDPSFLHTLDASERSSHRPAWFREAWRLVVDHADGEDVLGVSRARCDGHAALALYTHRNLYFVLHEAGRPPEAWAVLWDEAECVDLPSRAVAFGRRWYQLLDLTESSLRERCPNAPGYS